MEEFAFGTLSTPEKRLAYVTERRQGVKHYHRVRPRAPQAGDEPVITVTVAVGQAIERVLCHISQPQTAVIPLELAGVEWDLFNWQYVQTWQATLPPQPDGTLVRYTSTAHPQHSDETINADGGALFSYLVGDPAAPEWSRSAIVYQIFPDRFYPGNGRSWNPVSRLSDIYGGTLRGIIDKLDYIADMGFNCLWINPFFPDDTHHGYHATDYFSVNPRLGTLDDVRELVETAHGRGIRLLLDFVANHWSREHESFREAVHDRTSPYYDWYHWKTWPHEYETFFGVLDLPQINVNNPDVRDYLLRSVRFWLGDVGFDGLRLDYALGPSHDFWTDLRATVKAIKPDAWTFGEVTEPSDVMLSYEGRLDGCLDFPLMQAMRDTFVLERMSLSAFDNFLHNHERFFPDSFSLPSFLDNHDMNRFLWLAGEDKRKLKLAALCQFTLAGPPIVYNGTEVGVSQEMGMSQPGSQGMEESRQPMRWGEEQDDDLRNTFRWLIGLRREHPVLVNGRRRTLHLDTAARTYAYVREAGDQWLLIGLNLSEETRTFTVNTFNHTFTLPPWDGDIASSDKHVRR